MKKLFLIISLYSFLKADLILFLNNNYDLNYFPYLNHEYKEHTLNKEDSNNFIFKIDFRYKYIETNTVNYIIFEEENNMNDYNFEITGFYFGFKTNF
jgi:hypothetical protein